MAANNSTASPVASIGLYRAHILESAADYHDAAILELEGAKGLLAAFAQASESRAVPGAAPALWAIVEKLEAARHYSNAAWELGPRSKPALVVNR